MNPPRRIISSRLEGPRDGSAVRSELARRILEKSNKAPNPFVPNTPVKKEPVGIEAVIAARSGNQGAETVFDARDRLRRESRIREDLDSLKHSEVQRLVGSIIAQERDRQHHRMRGADPDTLQEMTQNYTDAIQALEHVQQILRAGTDDPEAYESATRTIEDLNAQIEQELKMVRAIHGLSHAASQEHHLAKPLLEELRAIQSVRNFFYTHSDTTALHPSTP